jgi:hypothetical protein
MAYEVFSADDPERALRSLLRAKVDGKPPGAGTDADSQFEAAVAVAREIMVNRLTKELAVAEVAEMLQASEPTVRNWYAKHRKAARAVVACQQLGWEGLPTWSGEGD